MTDDFWEDAEVVYSYTDEQAIEDGEIIPVEFGNISRVTRTVIEDFSDENQFHHFKFMAFMKASSEQLESMMKAKSDWFYEAVMNNRRYYFVENGAGYTLMKPEDY